MHDSDAVRKALDGHYAWIRDQVRDLLCEPIMAPTPQETIEAARDLTWQRLQRVAESPGPKLLFPKAYGGLDDLGAAITAFETLAHGDLSLLIKNGVQWGLFGGAVLHLGTQRHHDAYLRDIIDLKLVGSFAMTETGHGSDVASIRTTATFDADRDGFIISTPDRDAYKDYIGNAARDGHMAVVFAQLHTAAGGHGVHALLVPIRDEAGNPAPGVTIEDDGRKGGLLGVDNGRLAFDDVWVPRKALLNKYGDVDEQGTYSSPIEGEAKRFFTMLGTLVQGRVSVAAGGLSASKTALTIAVKYAAQRRQFTAPDSPEEIVILDYLAHQRKLLPAIANTYALHFAQAELIAMLNDVFTDPNADDATRRRLELLAAGTKATNTWHATRTIQMCREACGGQGYLAANRLVTIKADTDVFTTFEGDNTVLMQLVAKTLLTNYQHDFGELNTIGTIRTVAEQVVGAVVEHSGARDLVRRLVDAWPGHDNEASLRDRGWQLSMMQFRETHVLEGVARRMREGFNDGSDAFDVFNDVQDHILLAAAAHMDRVVLEAFVCAIDEIADESVKSLLETVCDLYALSRIEAERAWFLEHGRLTPTESKNVVSTVNELCKELRPHAVLLVDAFAIPDAAIGAPIAVQANLDYYVQSPPE